MSDRNNEITLGEVKRKNRESRAYFEKAYEWFDGCRQDITRNDSYIEKKYFLKGRRRIGWVKRK